MIDTNHKADFLELPEAKMNAVAGLKTGMIDMRALTRHVDIDVATAWRWIHIGILAGRDERVKLAARRIGARWYVSPADLEKFLELINT